MKGSDAFIIDQLARFLLFQNRTNELPRKYRKIFADDGMILKYFSKKNKLKMDVVEGVVRNNAFFELATSSITETFIFKHTTDMLVVRFSTPDTLRTIYKSDRKKLIGDARNSNILLDRLIGIHGSAKFDQLVRIDPETTVSAEYALPKFSHEGLFEQYLPKELSKYQEEAKSVHNLEKRFRSRVGDADSLRFKNGLVANNIMSWVQSILISDPDVARDHLLAGEFESWLRNSVKDRELANICSNLSRKVEEENWDAAKAKRELLNRLRKTSHESAIFNEVTKPLMRKLIGSEPETVRQTALKLKMLGDERSIEALIESLFGSDAGTRAVIMDALSGIGDPRAISPLIKVFEYSSDMSDRSNALAALANFDDERVRKLVQRCADDDDGMLGDEARAIRSKWQLGTPERTVS